MGSGLSSALAGLDRKGLAALLRARPDLAVPAPRNLEALANRAHQPGSLQRALEQLDAASLQALEGLLVLEPAPSGDGLAALLPGADLTAPMERLRSLALVWGPPERLRVPGNLSRLLPNPAGLGASARHTLPDWYRANELGEVLDNLTDEQRAVLEQLSGPNPFGRPSAATADIVDGLFARRLLLSAPWGAVQLPREVALVLRGELPLGAPARAPEVGGAALDPADVDAAGALESSELLRTATTVLRTWGTTPPAALRSGGLGVRELRALARSLDRSEHLAALVLEVLYGASLLAQDNRARWVPTADVDTWSRQPTQQRWSRLAAAWLELPRRPDLVGTRDDRDRPVAALSPLVTSWGARDLRRAVLGVLAELAAGAAPSGADLHALLEWRAPLRAEEWQDALEAVLEEGAALGVLSRGALTSAGRALVSEGAQAAADTLAAALPQPLDHVLLQADLTAVAPGPLRGDLADELDLLADTESAGAASVHRFSESSLRRAFDAGRTVEQVLDFLGRLSRTPVPQPLAYLVGDVARRYGLLRAGGAGGYVRSEDPGLLSEVLATPSLRTLKLRRIAPTVLVSSEPPTRVLEVLRAAGYAPVGDVEGGAAAVSGPAPLRAPARASWHGGERTLSTGALEMLLDKLEGAPSVPSSQLGLDLGGLVAALTEAANEGRPMHVESVDGLGRARRQLVRPLSVLDGTLVAIDLGTGVALTLPLRRVSGVREAEEAT